MSALVSPVSRSVPEANERAPAFLRPDASETQRRRSHGAFITARPYDLSDTCEGFTHAAVRASISGCSGVTVASMT